MALGGGPGTAGCAVERVTLWELAPGRVREWDLKGDSSCQPGRGPWSVCLGALPRKPQQWFHYWVPKARSLAPAMQSSGRPLHSDSSGAQHPPHLSDFCLCLVFPFKICSCSPWWWLVTMETTIRLFCSMFRKIAKCRQQPPLTYQRPTRALPYVL